MKTIEERAKEWAYRYPMTPDGYLTESDMRAVATNSYIQGATEQKAIGDELCKSGEASDGYHTFNELYDFRREYNAALVNSGVWKAHKSYRHHSGELCFGGGWFIVGIDTPEGSYTYHYENRYWDMFDCVDLPRAKHWDGHTEADAGTRLMSLEPDEIEGVRKAENGY